MKFGVMITTLIILSLINNLNSAENLSKLMTKIKIMSKSSTNTENNNKDKDSINLYTGAILIKTKHPDEIPNLEEYKVKFENESIILTPTDEKEGKKDINILYREFHTFEGNLIMKFEEFKKFNEKYYSYIKLFERIKDKYDNFDISYILAFKKEKNGDTHNDHNCLTHPNTSLSPNFKFLILSPIEGRESSTYEVNLIVNNILENYFANLVTRKFFWKGQHIETEELLNFLHWSEWKNEHDPAFLLTSVVNEGIVLSTEKIKKELVQVKNSFRYDQILNCEGTINDQDLTKDLETFDYNITENFDNVECCVSYSVNWLGVSKKEVFCSIVKDKTKCKIEIILFANTVSHNCFMKGISDIFFIFYKFCEKLKTSSIIRKGEPIINNLITLLKSLSLIDEVRIYFMIEYIKKYNLAEVNEFKELSPFMDFLMCLIEEKNEKKFFWHIQKDVMKFLKLMGNAHDKKKYLKQLHGKNNNISSQDGDEDGDDEDVGDDGDGKGQASSDGQGQAASDGQGQAASDGQGQTASDGLGQLASDGQGQTASYGLGQEEGYGLGIEGGAQINELGKIRISISFPFNKSVVNKWDINNKFHTDGGQCLQKIKEEDMEIIKEILNLDKINAEECINAYEDKLEKELRANAILKKIMNEFIKTDNDKKKKKKSDPDCEEEKGTKLKKKEKKSSDSDCEEEKNNKLKKKKSSDSDCEEEKETKSNKNKNSDCDCEEEKNNKLKKNKDSDCDCDEEKETKSNKEKKKKSLDSDCDEEKENKSNKKKKKKSSDSDCDEKKETKSNKIKKKDDIHYRIYKLLKDSKRNEEKKKHDLDDEDAKAEGLVAMNNKIKEQEKKNEKEKDKYKDRQFNLEDGEKNGLTKEQINDFILKKQQEDLELNGSRQILNRIKEYNKIIDSLPVSSMPNSQFVFPAQIAKFPQSIQVPIPQIPPILPFPPIPPFSPMSLIPPRIPTNAPMIVPDPPGPPRNSPRPPPPPIYDSYATHPPIIFLR